MMLLWSQIKAKKVKNIIEIYAKMRTENKCGNMPCSVNAHVGMTINATLHTDQVISLDEFI